MSKNILISRTDSLGDVILTLPSAGLLKKVFPEVRIYFLGNSYTQDVIEACEYVDEFVNWDEVSGYSKVQRIEFFKSLHCDIIVHVFPQIQIARLAYQSNIPLRIGTSHRYYHWLYCNKLVPLGRRNSNLHETQLNFRLLVPLGVPQDTILCEIPALYGLTRIEPLEEPFRKKLDSKRFNLILHPKSKGSAREWGLDNFGKLIALLPKDRYKIFVTGTNEDRKLLLPLIESFKEEIVDLTGQMNLSTLIRFIAAADGLVAASTGPLHIAAALKKIVVGLYAPMRPIHVGRWSPIGVRATYLSLDKTCSKCRKSAVCQCILEITPLEVFRKLESMRTD